MRINLERQWSERLGREPESGMGYQRVRVRLSRGRTIGEAMVFGGHVLQVDDNVEPFSSSEIEEITVLEASR